MNGELKYPWQQLLVEAFLASPAELSQKISAATRAISARKREVEKLDFSEEMALDDAVRALRVLASEANVLSPAQSHGERKISTGGISGPQTKRSAQGSC